MEGVDWAVNYLHSLVTQIPETFCIEYCETSFFKFHSSVIQCPFTIIVQNQLSKTTVMLKVKGEEEQGLPSDRIMIGGFSQVLNDKKFLTSSADL